MRRLALLLLAVLAECAPAPPRDASPEEGLAAVCKAGPDGAPPAPSPERRADRGIGGTGITDGGGQDRGIGGTGISGTVSGFASICVNGLEVHYDTAGSGLRVGDHVVIEALGPAEALAARRVAVRHEVSGPVEAVRTNGLLRVAGQMVMAEEPAGATVLSAVGDWVAVSGLRRPDGMILASRISPRVPGTVLVHGVAVLAEGQWHMGDLLLQAAAPGLAPQAGPLRVQGVYDNGVLRVERLTPDLLHANPALRFATAQRLVLEAYVSIQDGLLRLGGLRASLAAGLRAPGASSAPAVVDLRRQPDGSFLAVDLYPADQGGHETQADHPVGPPGHPFGLPTPGASSRPEAPGNHAAGGWEGSTRGAAGHGPNRGPGGAGGSGEPGVGPSGGPSQGRGHDGGRGSR